jgi:hypothetical protein
LVRFYVAQELVSDSAQILELFCGVPFSDGFARFPGSSLRPGSHNKRPDAYCDADDACNARD